MLSPRRSSSNPSLMRSNGRTCVIRSSMLMRRSMYQSTMRGTSVRPLRAAERGALPDAAGHQLERPRGDLLSRAGDADDDRLSPAAVGAFQCLTHDFHIADAFEAVICPAFRQVHQIRNQVALHLRRIDEVRHAELLGDVLALRVEVNADDHLGADQAQPLDHVQPDAAEPEHHDSARRPRPWPCSSPRRAPW